MTAAVSITETDPYFLIHVELMLGDLGRAKHLIEQAEKDISESERQMFAAKREQEDTY